jgi:hypothetical protein
MQFELVKIVCQSVVLVRDGDKIVDELEGQRVPCYTPEALQAMYEKAKAEVEQQNAAANGNRQQRRRRRPPAKKPEEAK